MRHYNSTITTILISIFVCWSSFSVAPILVDADEYIPIGSGTWTSISYDDIPFVLTCSGWMTCFDWVLHTNNIFRPVETIDLSGYTANKIHILEFANYADNVPDGVVVGHINVYYADDSLNTLDLVVGVNIAEWSYDRLEEQAYLQHTKIPPAYSFSTNQDSDYYYWGHYFYISIDTQKKPLQYLECILDPASYTGQQYYGYAPADCFGIVIPAITLQAPPPPVASFIYSPENPVVGETITFDASSSYDPNDGEVVAYNWDFGDGSTAEGQVITHSYVQPGEYTVTLTVTDNDGLTGFTHKIVSVKFQPIASFTYFPENPRVNEQITFDASDSYDPDGYEIVAYTWDFGDGNTADGQVITHSYTQPKDYTVTLIVTDNDGLTGSKQQNIVMKMPPVAAFDYYLEDPNNPELRNKIKFDANKSNDPDGQIVSYQWDFGDGSSLQGMVVTHTYTNAGDYEITLTVTDNDGLMDSQTHLYHLNVPVILVHGWRPVHTLWNTLKSHLEAAGIDYYIFDYSPATGDPKIYARQLKMDVDMLRLETGYKGKFDIVCHSMGALVTRWYMERLGGADNIRQWIGIAPVNNGSGLADLQRLIGWSKIKNLIPFLRNINFLPIEPAVTEMRTGSNTVQSLKNTLNPNVKYRVIAGINSKELPPVSNLPKFEGPFGGKTIFVKWFLIPWLTSRGDGVITLENAQIENHDIDCLRLDHNALLNHSEVCEKVVKYLLNPNTPSDNYIPGEKPGDSQRMIFGSEKEDTISVGETHNNSFAVDPKTEKITVGVDWPGSDMDLTLISPRGTILEPNDSLVLEYGKTDTSVWYTIDAPEVGEWTAQVEGVNTPPEGEQVWFRTLHSSSVVLEVTTDTNQLSYHVNECATVVAKIADENTPVTGAIVSAQMRQPDSSIEEIVLYDDGAQGDAVPNDGFYTTQQVLSQLGTYEITIYAKGTVDGAGFERTMPLALWVMLPQDFNYDGAVDFSDFAILAEHWLWTGAIDEDIVADGVVNFFDFAELSKYMVSQGTASPASNPNPANDASNVSIYVVLSWTPGYGATSHYIYFGTESPGTFQRNQTSDTFNPGLLSPNTKYYWRIDEVNSDGKTTGTVWSFTTTGKRICFPGDTFVWADGGIMKISEVIPGQKITAAGNFGKVQFFCEVESIQEHEGMFECYDIMLENGNCISVADSHYFLVDSGQWVALQNLKSSSRLQSPRGPITIVSVVKRLTPFVGKVYNLKVKDTDNYLVGQDGIIVRDY